VPCWYGLVEALQHEGALYIVNGEPSVWHAYQYGVAAVCTLGGESRIPSDRTLQELGAIGRPIRILFDDDAAGREGAQKLAQAFAANGIDVEIRGWQEARENLELPEKCDVDDLARLVKEELAETLSNFEIVPQDPVEKPMPREKSHWHLAEIVVQRLTHRGCPPIIHSDESQGVFWRYLPGKGYWAPIDEHEFNRETGSLNGAQVGFGEKPSYLEVSAGLKSSVFSCAIDQCHTTQFFSQSAIGVPFTNGFLTTRGLKLIPHSPDHRQTYNLGVAWEPEAKAPLFGLAIKNWFGENSQEELLLQEFAGAILFGIVGRSLWLIGGGENGKSQLIEIMSALVPDSARVSISPQMLADQKAEYYVSSLVKARLNVDADIPAREMVDSAIWKKSVTGDELTGRDPAGKPFKFRPRVLHLFSANDIPTTRDHTHGFWRRVMPLKMELRPGEFVEITDLAKKVLEQEKAGVIAWAIRGAERLLAQGWTEPESSTEAKTEWQQDSDQVARFAAEQLEVDVDNWIEASSLYKHYTEWARRTGSGQLSQTAFGRRVKQHIKSRKINGVMMYRSRLSNGYPF
jgi:P4 family phage/plasmid primase-like protien